MPFLIEQEIYKHDDKAKLKGWRLGKLHDEWNDLLNRYQLIVITAPRDHLKTFFFSEMEALRHAMDNANAYVRIFSKSDKLAIRILDAIKKHAEAPYFAHLLKGADRNSKTEIIFSNGSKIEASGFWSSQRGGHPSLMILDDVIDMQVVYSEDQNKKSRERLANEIIPMAEPDTKIIFVGTSQREDDIYNINWENETEGIHSAIHKNYDAIVDEDNKITLFPEMWTWQALMEKKRQIVELAGERFFLKEYRGKMVAQLGTLINPQWLKTYKTLPHVVNDKGEVVMKKLEVYTGWDLSVGKDPEKGDYTAKITFAYDYETRLIYILSVYRARINFARRVHAIGDHAESDRPLKVAVEDNVFQTDTMQTAKNNFNVTIIGVTTIRNKNEKFEFELAPLFENGRVLLLEGDKMQMLFWEELLSLPSGEHDDMADAFCNGLKLLPIAKKASDYIILLKK